jgi:phosphate acetyltransferase
MVAGAVNSSANLLRVAFTVVGLRTGNKTASSCFVMILPDRTFGHDGQMIFADCATVPSPDAHQLADIAIASAETGKSLLGLVPVVAMLSFSTKGSATHESLDKVIHAGELQADAAVVESVARTKCPGSPVNGKANILIFPDLNSGNICYKLVQRLAKAEAFGPVLQGLAKPVNDLSRGCTTDDIVNVVTITAVQTSLQ